MNISDPIPISSTGSSGSIVGGADAGRQRSNNTQSSGSAIGASSRMDSGSIPQSSSSSSANLNNHHYTFPGNGTHNNSNNSTMQMGSPNGSNGFTNSPSNMNMAGLSLDPSQQQSAPGPSSSSSTAQQQQQQSQIVPVGFEEGTLRALCDLDCGFPLLMDRIKQSMASCRVSDGLLAAPRAWSRRSAFYWKYHQGALLIANCNFFASHFVSLLSCRKQACSSRKGHK